VESTRTSLLLRITDFLGSISTSIGGLFGMAPTHHLMMENLLHGQEPDSEWQIYDSNPVSFFFPERDIAGGKLARESTRSKLADKFNDRLLLSLS
jgi:hypothetical protein